ncbi:hypothetical protein K435DRAFT_938089 [Dendrothele bispora CBS 962.96]|uniref:Uncharacterized protein n=1 Tax=Dendrothele bispora (strain CBS 962.96) TaxID=1314807 RepID=A0A4S8KMQ1_DENBC|nr:hypothetical protein K435DRAFT_813361 [Dendrothele bispora CBS 962.96]THU81067.1 hypothetical protein K435DRAFT_938089 [Dendrothele bispora CBS 962.96]
MSGGSESDAGLGTTTGGIWHDGRVPTLTASCPARYLGSLSTGTLPFKMSHTMVIALTIQFKSESSVRPTLHGNALSKRSRLGLPQSPCRIIVQWCSGVRFGWRLERRESLVSGHLSKIEYRLVRITFDYFSLLPSLPIPDLSFCSPRLG